MHVQHQPERRRFVIVVAEQESVLEYRETGPAAVEFTRTFVPAALRGQGIAEQLVRSGLRWAREQGYEYTASCWYVQRFLKQGRRDGE